MSTDRLTTEERPDAMGIPHTSTHSVPDFVAPPEGELSSVSVGGRVIAVAVCAERVYAFDDACTHAQCSLSAGDVEGLTVVCPCHGGTFLMATGAVLSGPPPEPVQTYPARLIEGRLEIDVDLPDPVQASA
jgi:nitrite reductase/ring-hydroxylating ferredoxin subunit